jgi:hypothetical protein
MLYIKDDGWNDVKCPHCNTMFGVEDGNDSYDGPSLGDYDVTCLNCDEPFTIESKIVYKGYSDKATI